jgi:HPt (histidine-containing phosphotransfer) domain-containing protein
MSLYDYSASLKRMAGDTGLLREMAGLFVADVPPKLEDFRRALKAGDLKSASKAAHALKGLALNFGAARACKAAEAMERGATSPQFDLAAASAELEESFAELLPALRKLAGDGLPPDAEAGAA